jgi:hypothetical protein
MDFRLRRLARLVLVILGLGLGQAFLYGPCLIGQKILLPVDLLAREGYYLPEPPGSQAIEPKNLTLTDQLELFEPARQFAVSEIRAGRLPKWAPYEFGGVPFIWPKFSPFSLIQCLTASPVILAWSQLAAALVAGLGAYFFSRQTLGVGFWPAALAAWCYPLTAFLVLWQGFATAGSVYWLPWLMLAMDRTVRRVSPWAPLGLGIVTCAVLVSGHVDVAGQVLLTAGLYAAWRLFLIAREAGTGRALSRSAVAAATGLALGFLLAAPYLLPVLEYSASGSRLARRAAGEEERPPVGLSTLPQTVLPDLYGSSQTGSVRLDEGTESESAAATYTGAVATLLLAPLAWCSRRHRRHNAFWGLLVLLGLAWCLNLPGAVQILRLPGLNFFSHNRFVFASSFALLALMATGLEVLNEGTASWRPWFWIPTGLLAVLCLWCVHRANHLPAAITSELETLIQQGQTVGLTHDLEGVRRIQAWFVGHYAAGALLCGLGLAGWLSLRRHPQRIPWRVGVLGFIIVGDLLWFAHGRSPQCDRHLCFPPVPALVEVTRATPGRIVGHHCLPASLAAMCGLNDIRGYDGVDPRRMVELVQLAADPQSSARTYAAIQWLTPKLTLTPQGDAQLHPVLDMLGVRYVVFRGSAPPSARVAFQSQDYFILTNPAAMPRAFVPRRVEVAIEKAARLQRLASAQFDPREVAVVETPLGLPDACRGTVELRAETATHLSFSVNLETAGIIVLADRWDPGWSAYLNGVRVPILQVNHAVRGVVAPQGLATLEFRYEPRSFAWGLILAGTSTMALSLWSAWLLRLRFRQPATQA